MGFNKTHYETAFISTWWHLSDTLTVEEAVLLTLGVDPEKYERNSKRPTGYDPVKGAISSALQKGAIEGRMAYDVDCGEHFLDVFRSTVDVDSLKIWLSSRGVSRGFFFTGNASESPGYLSPEHKRYSPRLAAAVKAWLAMEDHNLYSGKSPKKAMEQWLESNYKALELVHKRDGLKHGYKAGDMNKSAISEAAKLANWEDEGGTPKTPERTLPTLKENLSRPNFFNVDDKLDNEEIPF